MKFPSEKNVDKNVFKRAPIAILGCGDQIRARALNLKESGFDVVIGAWLPTAAARLEATRYSN